MIIRVSFMTLILEIELVRRKIRTMQDANYQCEARGCIDWKRDARVQDSCRAGRFFRRVMPPDRVFSLLRSRFRNPSI